MYVCGIILHIHCTVYEFRIAFREPDQATLTEEHSKVLIQYCNLIDIQ